MAEETCSLAVGAPAAIGAAARGIDARASAPSAPPSGAQDALVTALWERPEGGTARHGIVAAAEKARRPTASALRAARTRARRPRRGPRATPRRATATTTTTRRPRAALLRLPQARGRRRRGGGLARASAVRARARLSGGGGAPGVARRAMRPARDDDEPPRRGRASCSGALGSSRRSRDARSRALCTRSRRRCGERTRESTSPRGRAARAERAAAKTWFAESADALRVRLSGKRLFHCHVSAPRCVCVCGALTLDARARDARCVRRSTSMRHGEVAGDAPWSSVARGLLSDGPGRNALASPAVPAHATEAAARGCGRRVAREAPRRSGGERRPLLRAARRRRPGRRARLARDTARGQETPSRSRSADARARRRTGDDRRSRPARAVAVAALHGRARGRGRTERARLSGAAHGRVLRARSRARPRAPARGMRSSDGQMRARIALELSPASRASAAVTPLQLALSTLRASQQRER